MLVVVNSFAGEYSDTQRLARIIRKAHPGIPVLQLASEVIRDPKRMKAYEDALRRIERDRQNYVILATSVVEMGITFPTLDYVVTMDSGYDQETIGDVTFPVVAPLGVNSLLQRIGRVGRRRPGIAYIANEIGADYAELDDDELNAKQALVYEQITFPLASSPLMPLAYYARSKGWYDISMQITDLNLPSKLHENPDRMAYLHEQVAMLETLGLARNNQLTPLGESMEKWIGQADLAYAVQLQKCFEEGARLPDVVFWIVATALSNTPLVTLRTKYDYFVDRDGSHSDLPHSIDVWSHRIHHEDVSAFMLFTRAAASHPLSLFGGSASRPDDIDMREFEKWCNLAGADPRKLVRAAKAVQETWKLFGRINGKTNQYRAIFGDVKSARLGTMPWRAMRNTFPQSTSWMRLYDMLGNTPIRLIVNEATGGYTWIDAKHGYQGLLSQDDTPIPLGQGGTFVGRLVPSRKAKGGEAAWHPTHLGLQPLPVTPVKVRPKPRKKKRSWWRRLLSL